VRSRFLLAALLWAWAAFAAHGHATLVSSEPRDGAVLPAGPATLSLTFNEAVRPVALRLVGPNGDSVLGRYRVDGAVLAIEPPAQLAEGTHALSWRVISADGHPIGGSVVFSIGSPGAAPPPGAAQEAAPGTRPMLWAARVLVLLGLFVGVGAAAFAVFLAPAGDLPRDARRTAAAVIAAGLVAAPLSVGLQGLDILLLPLSWLGDPAPWRAGFASTYGTAAMLAALALATAGAGLFTGRRSARLLLATGALAALGAAFVGSGHASTAEPRIVSRGLLLVHVLAVVLWIGSLVPLLAFARRGDVFRALARFSRIIPLPLAALVASGVALAVIQLGTVTALWTTGYGSVLVLKSALVIALLGVAAFNRFVLTPALRIGEARARGRFAATLVAEIALAALILATVALWRFTPPPRSLASARAAPVFTHIHAGAAMADITAREQRGRWRLAVVLQTGDFRPLRAKEVSLVLANRGAGIEPITRAAVQGPEPDLWTVEDFVFPAPGVWRVTVEVLISDFERTELTGDLVLPP
jgi:copper transport protein